VPQSAALLESQESAAINSTTDAVAAEARRGLTASTKSLAPWLFYDAPGSRLFEQITTLPEYYLTRAEREIFTAHAAEIFQELEAVIPGSPGPESVILSGAQSAQSKDLRLPLDHPSLTIAELGAGTASKTGILLRALAERQPHVLYQPIDISPTALDEARTQLEAALPILTVRPRVANYVTEPYAIDRIPNTRVLTLYIGSSIGNFSPAEARQILTGLRAQLQPGDALLLGTDLAPCPPEVAVPAKSAFTLLSAYNDKQGVTAAFNLNILARLNRELGADFDLAQFTHRALWNHTHSRIEMHLKSLAPQRVTIPANSAGPALHINFFAGETIHTENSYKFTPASIAAMLTDTGFAPTRTFTDPASLFAVTLATAL
jgi:L-histidine N-alpha-methyltransferase